MNGYDAIHMNIYIHLQILKHFLVCCLSSSSASRIDLALTVDLALASEAWARRLTPCTNGPAYQLSLAFPPALAFAAAAFAAAAGAAAAAFAAAASFVAAAH